jgi:cathepsin D
LAGKPFILRPSDYILKIENTCFSGFRGSYGSFWIFGDVFLGAYYSEYDSQKFRIGFATSKSFETK